MQPKAAALKIQRPTADDLDMDLHAHLPAPLGIELVEFDDAYDRAMAAVQAGTYWPEVLDVRAKLTKVYGEPLGKGLTRNVHDGRAVVYKTGTVSSNWMEAKAHADPSFYGGLPVAKCRLVWTPFETRYRTLCVPVLIMETVLPATADDELPEWARRVDCEQLGRNSAGEWVVFDAGSSMCLAPGPRLHHAVPSLYAQKAA